MAGKKKPTPKRDEERKKTSEYTFDKLFGDVNYKEYTRPYSSFKKEYLKQLEKLNKKKEKKRVCYIVTYKDVEGIMYVAFATSRDEAIKIATNYFIDLRHPEFKNTSMAKKASAKRRPTWDRYSKAGKVPVYGLLMMGCKFPCCYCGRYLFTYRDLLDGKCTIIDDELSLNPFTKGIVVCKDCESKLNFTIEKSNQ